MTLSSLVRKEYRSTLETARTELNVNGKLSETTLELIIEIGNLPKPKVWPCPSSYKFKAFKLLRENSDDIIRRWGRSFYKKNVHKYVNKAGVISKEQYGHAKFSTIDESINAAIMQYYATDNKVDQFYLTIKKTLYSKIGNYKFLEELPDHHFVKILRGVQNGDENSMYKLFRMKRKKLSSGLSGLRIPLADKNTLIGLALFNAAKNATFVGGFDTYTKMFLKGEVRKYFKDFSDDKKSYSYKRDLEKEIADVSSIKLFDTDTYEDLLYMSEVANANHGYIRVNLSPYSPKLHEKISKLMYPKGEMISEYIKFVIPLFLKELAGPRVDALKQDLYNLFRAKYSKIDEYSFNQVIGKCIDGTADENTLAVFNKEKEELILQDNLLHRDEWSVYDKKYAKKISVKNLPKMQQLYLSIVSRIIIPIESYLSNDALSMPYKQETDIIKQNEILEERLDMIEQHAKEAAEKFLGFELLPQELKEQAVLSIIRGEDIKILASLGQSDFSIGMISNMCLDKDYITHLSDFGDVKKLFSEFYQKNYLILNTERKTISSRYAGEKSDQYFRTMNVIDEEILAFSVSGCKLDKMEQALGTNSSYVTKDVIKLDDITFKLFLEKKGKELHWELSRDVSDIAGEEDLELFVERLHNYKKEAERIGNLCYKSGIDVPTIIPSKFMLIDETIIFNPQFLFSENNSYQGYAEEIRLTFDDFEEKAEYRLKEKLRFYAKFVNTNLSSLNTIDAERLKKVFVRKGFEVFEKEYDLIPPDKKINVSLSEEKISDSYIVNNVQYDNFSQDTSSDDFEDLPF